MLFFVCLKNSIEIHKRSAKPFFLNFISLTDENFKNKQQLFYFPKPKRNARVKYSIEYYYQG